MAMLLSSFAFAQYGYGYATSNGGGEEKKRMTLTFESGCDGTVITANGASYALEGVHITVMDVAGGLLFSGDTDANGQVSFEGCGRDVRVYASRSGYKKADLSGTLVSCEQCEEPEEELPPQEEQPPAEAGPQYECETDADCDDDEYCAQLAVAAGTECREVAGGCGVVANHAFTAYECGAEPGCPSCQQGEVCSGNSCYPAEITGPDNGETGDTVTYTVSLGGAPCDGLEVRVTDPTGAVTTYITDANCQITFPLNGQGQYQVELGDGGKPIASRTLTSTAPLSGGDTEEVPTAPEGQQGGNGGSGMFGMILALLLLLLLVLGGWYLVMPMFQKGKK